jgi:hypothetical protein
VLTKNIVLQKKAYLVVAFLVTDQTTLPIFSKAYDKNLYEK